LIASTTELEVVVSAEKEHWKAAAAKRDTAEQQLQQQEAEVGGVEQSVRYAPSPVGFQPAVKTA
jgi:hypothetical protein